LRHRDGQVGANVDPLLLVSYGKDEMLPAHPCRENHPKLSEEGLVCLELKFGVDSREGGQSGNGVLQQERSLKKAVWGTAVL